MSDTRRPGLELLLALDRGMDRLTADVSRGDGSPVAGPVAGVPDGPHPGQGGVADRDTGELLDVASRLAALSEDDWDEVAPLYQGARSRRPVPWRSLLAVAAAIAALAVVVSVVVPGGNRAAQRPASSVGSSGPSGPSGSSGPVAAASWRLAGFIGQAAWTLGSSAGTPAAGVLLTCPAPGTCYADQLGPASAATVVEVTTDTGATWHASNVPAGYMVTSAPSCPSARTCAVAAVAPATGETALLVTSDGGGSWRPHAVAVGGVLSVTILSCSSSSACVALGHGPATGSTPRPPVALWTANGGATWSTGTLSAPFIPEVSGGISCPSKQSCVVVGLAVGTQPRTPGQGAVRYTTDGGATWSAGTVPAGITFVQSVSCPQPSICVAVANRGDGNSISLTSSDGGRTWRLAGTLLTGTTVVGTVACPTASDCFAGGFRDISGVLLGSQDGGSTWGLLQVPSAPLPGSPFTSLDLQDVAVVACPPTGSCVAIGWVPTAQPTDRQVVLRS